MVKTLTEIFSPSGFEDGIRELLISKLGRRFDKILVDNLGNLILRTGKAERLCIECGMDSAGVMVVSKGDDRLFFSAFGGLEPKSMIDRKIVFANGELGIVRIDEKVEPEKAKFSDLYIEIETEQINIGDFGAIVGEFGESDDKYSAYGIKNRIGLAAVCQAIAECGECHDVTILFSAQKRLGGRGIRAFFSNKKFDRVILVDGCGADGGCMIVAKDSRTVSNVSLRETVEEVAKTENISSKTVVCEDNFYMENIIFGGNDSRCVALGISVKTEDDKKESVKKEDYAEMVKLVKELMK